MNNTVAGATGFTPSELMFGGKSRNIFEGLLPEIPEGGHVSGDVQRKTAKAYETMKRKLDKRRRNKKKGKAHWTPKVNDKVLLRTQPVSDAMAGVTAKFLHPYEGPYIIARIIPPSTFELAGEKARVRGQFNKRLLKAYKEATNGDEFKKTKGVAESSDK